jgi:hypothetical protein
VAGVRLATADDNGGRAGRLRGCEARPHMLAVWTKVAHTLLATCAGGYDYHYPWQASTSGGGLRRRGSGSTGGSMRIRGTARLS